MKKYYLLYVVLLISSCRVNERAIVCGSDECEHCKMLIMDKRYGSEIVTSKGKVYTFDSVECLIEFIYENEDSGMDASTLLVTSYTDPGRLIDAKTASFLISGQMPSPMGAFLTAFSDYKVAKEFYSSSGGYLYTWEELIRNFKEIKLKAIKEFD